MSILRKQHKEAKDNAIKNIDNTALNSFRNRMRQSLTTGWETSNGDTKVTNWQTYAQKLEKEVFDLINEIAQENKKPEMGGRYNG